MSHKSNDIFWENIKEEYDGYVSDRNWDEVRKMGLRLEEAGYSEMEKELSETLTQEEIEDYKKWDEKTNGSTETQMDDN